MTANNTFKQFIKYSALNVLGMIGLSCYILADTFFISQKLGANGLTALNLALPIYSLVHGTGLMLGMGSATKYSIFRAQKKQHDADAVFTNTLYVTTIFSLIFVLCGIFLSPQITVLLGADSSVFPMTNTYLKMILLFSPAFILNDISICLIRNDGAPKLAMIAMISGSLSNIVLDYIFLFPLNMGIFGAVLATGFAPIISMCILSAHLIRKKNSFSVLQIAPKFKKVTPVFLLGIPSLITELSSGIVMVIFNVLLLRTEGNTGVAAYGIIANLALVIVSVFTGIAQGMQPLLSYARGKNNKETIKKLLRYGTFSTLILASFIYIFLFICDEPITAIFNQENNTQLQHMAVNGLKLYFISTFFTGLNIIFSTYFSATEKAVPAQIISILRGLLLIIPIAFIMSHFFGLTGIWLALPITELLVTFLALGIYFFF